MYSSLLSKLCSVRRVDTSACNVKGVCACVKSKSLHVVLLLKRNKATALDVINYTEKEDYRAHYNKQLQQRSAASLS